MPCWEALPRCSELGPEAQGTHLMQTAHDSHGACGYYTEDTHTNLALVDEYSLGL